MVLVLSALRYIFLPLAVFELIFLSAVLCFFLYRTEGAKDHFFIGLPISSVALYSVTKGYLDPSEIKDNIKWSNIFWICVNCFNLFVANILAFFPQIDTSLIFSLGEELLIGEVGIVKTKFWGPMSLLMAVSLIEGLVGGIGLYAFIY